MVFSGHVHSFVFCRETVGLIEPAGLAPLFRHHSQPAEGRRPGSLVEPR